MKRRRSGKLRRRSHRSYSRSREELEASREKLGFAHQESRMNQAHNQVCGRNACQNTAAVTCEFCKRQFCREHSAQTLVESHAEVTNLTNKDYRDDPELYNKRINDWNRRDGHPCSSYTGWWLAEHSKKMEAGLGYKGTCSSPSPTYSTGYPSNTGHVDYEESPKPQTRPDIRDPRQEAHPSLIKTSAILVAIAVVVFIFFVVFYEPSQATGTGTSHLPYNANLGWQGAGYYSYQGSEVYAGSKSQLESVTNASTSLPTTVYTNQTVANTATPNVIIINVTNIPETIPITTATTAPSLIQNITSGISQALHGQTINSSWASEFFANVSAQRGSGYAYCSSLSQFAAKRFSTMAANYEVSHYGYDQDFQDFYGVIYNTAFGEEVFYPSGYSPSAYVSQIQSTAPLHWQLLSNSTYRVYGYYIANGPTYEIYGPDGGYGGPCPVTEIPGPNINIQQYFAQYGCSVTEANDTWFVIEIASSCP